MDLKASFEKSFNVVNFKPAQFKLLHSVVSIGAVKKIVRESKELTPSTWITKLVKTCELSCEHDLAEFARINMHIPLKRIDGFWRKLDMQPLVFA